LIRRAEDQEGMFVDELTARVQARVGSVLAGKYRIEDLLGVGGMGAVYRATNQAVGREVAIKILHPELSVRADLRKRFLREALAANAVKHPGVVSVLDHDVDENGSAFLVMDLLTGESLEQRWERAGRTLGVAEVVALMLELLDVLVAAHARGVTHRDLKIENLFMAADGRLRVLDFGVARLCAAPGTTLTGVGEVFGTPAYMSPEQALGQGPQVDAQSDLWSAGAVAFTLLSGRCVHDVPTVEQTLIAAATRSAPRLASVAPHVSPAVATVFDRALAFRKRDRWASAEAMRGALAEAQDAILGASSDDASEWEGGRTRLSAPPAAHVLRAEGQVEHEPLPFLVGLAPRPGNTALGGVRALLGHLGALVRLSVRFERLVSREASRFARSSSTLRHRRRLTGAAGAGLLTALVIGSVAVAVTGVGARRTAGAGTNGGAATSRADEALDTSTTVTAELSNTVAPIGTDGSQVIVEMPLSSPVASTEPIVSATATARALTAPFRGLSPSPMGRPPFPRPPPKKRDPFAP
jgi:serine/threonine-protein kinase